MLAFGTSFALHRMPTARALYMFHLSKIPGPRASSWQHFHVVIHLVQITVRLSMLFLVGNEVVHCCSNFQSFSAAHRGR